MNIYTQTISVYMFIIIIIKFHYNTFIIALKSTNFFDFLIFWKKMIIIFLNNGNLMHYLKKLRK